MEEEKQTNIKIITSHPEVSKGCVKQTERFWYDVKEKDNFKI